MKHVLTVKGVGIDRCHVCCMGRAAGMIEKSSHAALFVSIDHEDLRNGQQSIESTLHPCHGLNLFSADTRGSEDLLFLEIYYGSLLDWQAKTLFACSLLGQR